MFSSRMPRRMVLCASPVAALTAVIPPRPKETASTAAQRRRPRSVNSGGEALILVLDPANDTLILHAGNRAVFPPLKSTPVSSGKLRAAP